MKIQLFCMLHSPVLRPGGSTIHPVAWRSGPFGFASARGLAATARRWLERAVRRRRLRDSLASMDIDRVERDIGVTPGSLCAEAYKPFWRE